MLKVSKFKVTPVSLVRKDGLQRIQLSAYCSQSAHFLLEAIHDNVVVAEAPIALSSGEGIAVVYLPKRKETLKVVWRLKDQNGAIVAKTSTLWEPILQRTFYIMVSSHTDIGLHNSQYIQRYNSVEFTDKAAQLCDQTDTRNFNDKYRYTIEGTWFWNNYTMERGRARAHLFAERYIKSEKIGICGGVAGNHTQVYGLEELCRSAYEKRRLSEEWDIDTSTLSMIDNNGISMSVIQPYAEAGYKNIFFAPNHWNPIPSSIWHKDTSFTGPLWNSNANGGGSRIDVRYASELPMVFFWENFGNQLLVWCSTAYEFGGQAFGLMPNIAANLSSVEHIENCMADQLPRMDQKYPYKVWLLACYSDDQEPDMGLTDTIQIWNEKWEWPKLRTLGDPNAPFTILREQYAGQIPHLSGDITGGWYQHPVSTPELLAQKFEVDRTLPTAEKWATIAAIVDPNYKYPACAFRRAWDYLLFNDEHSYGTSGYSGRRVYETWMQHRDWIEKAQSTAIQEKAAAIRAIVRKISISERSLVVFNQTSWDRTELIEFKEKYTLLSVPAFGYAVCPVDSMAHSIKKTETSEQPPIIENEYYIIRFNESGALFSIYDKELSKELLDASSPYGANTFLYTNDNHCSYFSPKKATFETITEAMRTTVIVNTLEINSGAEIIQKITLSNHSKYIDIDNTLNHISDMVNSDRYHRYAYFAFPFYVSEGKRLCHLNGTIAEYASSVTGHGTDVYMASREWSCVENHEFGIALFQMDSSLIEFDHIHPEKTDFGNTGDGSNIYCYLANDWLQMHVPGGSHLNYRFRYRIVSYPGDHHTAGIAQQAELFVNPVDVCEARTQNGVLDDKAQSFFIVTPATRLVCLKRADDGNGLIARLYGKYENTQIKSSLFESLSCEPSTIDEVSVEHFTQSGFITCRLGNDSIRLTERNDSEACSADHVPAPIGSVYTGLISEPRAVCGEDDGQLYLLWGKNAERNVSHYNLYRGESTDFIPNAQTLIAQVKAEQYCVCRYVDTNLKTHTTYYYRVCAVAEDGTEGPISDVFSGVTREEITQHAKI